MINAFLNGIVWALLLFPLVAAVLLVLWSIQDAKLRGKSPLLISLAVVFFFPWGLIAWLIFRPQPIDPTKLNPRVAALLYGKDPMPVNPKEFHSLVRARGGLVMPATVCSSYVLPWLQQFKTLVHVDWKPRRGVMIQHRFAEAAANFVLGSCSMH